LFRRWAWLEVELKFKINDIGPKGVDCARRLGAGELRNLLGPGGIELMGDDPAAEVVLHLDRTGENVLVRGGITGVISVACSRCLGPAAVRVEEPDLAVTFLPQSLAGEESEEERELTVEDLDTFAHDGLEIDLEPLVREAFVLAVPIAPLCAEQCQGLCGECGADLNRESCQCPRDEEDDSPWVAALRRIKKAN
jgi:uncharacterized protein